MSTTTTLIETRAPIAVPRKAHADDLVSFTTKAYGDWRDDFHKYGCTVVKGVISRARAAYYRQKQLEWLKKFELGFDENDKSTWTVDHLPCSFKGGMYMLYGSTHENFVWESRLEPGVIDVFAKLWETEDLLVDYNGFNISFPKRADVKWSPWPHCDQSPHRKGMQAVQGLLNYAPNGPNDGGLVLMKGASNLFDEFFATKRESFAHEDAPPADMEWNDLFLFSQEDVKWFEARGCELVKVNLDEGDLVLWDSRTMHYARLPEGDQIRHVQYVTMTPKRFATQETLDLRKQCFDEYKGTTHWPHRNVFLHQWPPMRGDQVCPKNRAEPFEKPEVTDRMLQLVGCKAY